MINHLYHHHLPWDLACSILMPEYPQMQVHMLGLLLAQSMIWDLHPMAQRSPLIRDRQMLTLNADDQRVAETWRLKPTQQR